MNQTRKEMIALVIKESRVAKGYTQKELAELSSISIRSIQRIENGDILPRAYTLKSLAKILDRPYEDFARLLQTEVTTSTEHGIRASRMAFGKMNLTQRTILSVGVSLFIFFFSWAFVAQSSRFPETLFELLVFVCVMVLLTTGILWLIWNKK